MAASRLEKSMTFPVRPPTSPRTRGFISFTLTAPREHDGCSVASLLGVSRYWSVDYGNADTASDNPETTAIAANHGFWKTSWLTPERSLVILESLQPNGSCLDHANGRTKHRASFRIAFRVLIMAQEVNPELCRRYAQFASHMVRWQFKIIYWTLFITNLFVLFLASWTYIRGQETLERFHKYSANRAKRLRQCIYLCLGCVLASTVIVIMEAYAIMALQFCDGEDLISLYWSTWTMIQVGSLIAMVGIILALCNSLRNRGHPPWALALGTPVLVIAGVLHLFHDCTTRRIGKQIRKKMEVVDDINGPPISQANTIQANDDDDGDEYQSEIVGFTIDGGPIIKFMNAIPDPLPNHIQLLGYCDKNRPIVVCRKDAIQFITELPARTLETPTKCYKKDSKD
ncbi:hypothetical protein G7046_g3140 [Stylonectria norvegica]|nr:hypothetical protein G7046_g3140 [Stylonectria norvegica]